jgi:hypothetical protein
MPKIVPHVMSRRRFHQLVLTDLVSSRVHQPRGDP